MRSQGTAFIMTRGPALVARHADQLLIYLGLEGSCDNDWAGRRGPSCQAISKSLIMRGRSTV